MSAPAIPAYPVPVPAPPRRRGRARAALPLAGGLLLGLGVATGDVRLLAAAVLPLALATIARPDGAVLLFAAGMYLNLPVLAAAHFGLPGAVTGAFAMLLVVPFVGYVVIGRAPLVLTPALGLMIAWLLVLVLSAINAGAPSPSITAIVTFLTEGLLLYVLVTNVVRTPRTLRAVLWVLVLAGAAMGLGSVWQEATHSYHQTLWGFAQIDANTLTVGGNTADARPRLAGPIGEKNSYARTLIVLLPLALTLWRIERRPLARAGALACAALILSGMVLTFSRGAAVAMALLLTAAVVLRIIPLRRVLLLVGVVTAFVFAVAPDYVARVQSLGAADTATSQQSSADAAVRGRATENLAAFYVFRDHLVLGGGPGEFFSRYSQQYGNQLDLRFLKTNRRAHNLYLEIAADTGVLGLGLFLAIVGVTLVGLRRLARLWAARRRPDLVAFADGLLLALVAYLACGLFLQLNYERYFWLLVALANAAIWMLRPVPTTPPLER